jgi:hypothetical protein
MAQRLSRHYKSHASAGSACMKIIIHIHYTIQYIIIGKSEVLMDN